MRTTRADALRRDFLRKVKLKRPFFFAKTCKICVDEVKKEPMWRWRPYGTGEYGHTYWICQVCAFTYDDLLDQIFNSGKLICPDHYKANEQVIRGQDREVI